MTDGLIPLSVPNLRGRELEYATDAIESEWVSTAGPYVNEFEQAVAHYVGVESAVACQSGTAGLHLALLSSGVTSEDAVIVPTLTFIAAVNPVTYIGALPLFMDCGDDLCMDPDKLRCFCRNECLKDGGRLIHEASGREVKAMVIVHVFGNMANMVPLMEVATEYGMRVIEDATESLGTYFEEGPYAKMHAGTVGNVGVYSFNGNKIITTGGGGMVVSNDEKLLSSISHLSTQAKSNPLYYEHDKIGYNYRLTNLQAALGLAQMEQLEGFVEVKNRNYCLYRELLQDLPNVRLLGFREGVRSNRWFYSLLGESKEQRDTLIEGLSEQGIQTRPIWGLIHEQAPYAEAEVFNIERALFYRDRVVNLPCSTNLRSEDICRVVEAIKGII